ncbi:MAG: hypothetical protein K0R00_190 [Herbinix sp.]|jgi:hypothetical protein|nr:hypothetical protein [Herbinix sp.]
MSAITTVYYELVKAGSRTIDQVPSNLRADVQALIDADVAANTQPTN